MPKIDREKVRAFLDSATGGDVKQYLLKKYWDFEKLSNVDDRGTAEAQAIEVKAHKKASKLLKEILSEILTWEKTPTGRDPRDETFVL